MKWMRERDALIAQTLAFVQSVTGRRDAGEPLPLVVPEPAPTTSPPAEVASPVASAPPGRPRGLDAKSLEAKSLETKSLETKSPDTKSLDTTSLETSAGPVAPPSPRPLAPSDFQRELKVRIASFRAHQERFNREREAYFSATLARLRAAIEDGPPSGPRG
jgi:hypothetical protein